MFIQTEVVDGVKPGDKIIVIVVIEGDKRSRVRVTVPKSKNDELKTEILDNRRTM